MSSLLCEVCGNELEPGRVSCPYCRAACIPARGGPAGLLQQVVNLEKGMPQVQQALDRLASALATARLQGVKILTLIHGYGSSGRGGAIKTAVRQQLHYWGMQGLVREILPGEEFEGRSKRGRQLLRRFPALAAHRDLNRANPGITLVIL